MNKIVTAVAAACVLASTAAYAGPFDGAYGNTVTRTAPDGSKTIIYVNADGTWQQTMGAMTVKGTFTWKDPSTACFRQTDPTPSAQQTQMQGDGCQNFPASHAVGDSWTEKGPDGKDYAMAITAGR